MNSENGVTFENKQPANGAETICRHELSLLLLSDRIMFPDCLRVSAHCHRV